MKTKALAKAPKHKPEYKGEKFDRTSDEKLLCRLCDKLATHAATVHRESSVGLLAHDLFYCEFHLNQDIKNEVVLHKIRLLPKYRTYLGQLARWEEAQRFHETQTSFL